MRFSAIIFPTSRDRSHVVVRCAKCLAYGIDLGEEIIEALEVLGRVEAIYKLGEFVLIEVFPLDWLNVEERCEILFQRTNPVSSSSKTGRRSPQASALYWLENEIYRIIFRKTP